ncbi:MAG: 2OG-Fe(II) oxygenase [Candidatus Koribacter versatilis]|uniref:2OG-Fe(II) oxygenase n=1 Tax=Candidatus Korobacter versatilis TaxID=658062 RepID=A0A932A6M0_9BACT|nr:2OG-Fe(II) oxygenase [Candidatus Koribacter versatilis]
MTASSTATQVRLDRSGVTVPVPETMRELAQQFQRQHHVVFRGFLPPELLAKVRADIASGKFSDFVSKGVGADLTLQPSIAVQMLRFMLNQPSTLAFARALSGIESIRGFWGRVYTMLPRPEHFDSWHDDLVDGRQLSITLNLGEVYEGGALEMRSRSSKQVLWAIRNTGPGDAIFFALAPDLQHRVTSVTGAVGKTALAGWFLDRESDFVSLVHQASAAEPD